jgi:hypothetical protein
VHCVGEGSLQPGRRRDRSASCAWAKDRSRGRVAAVPGPRERDGDSPGPPGRGGRVPAALPAAALPPQRSRARSVGQRCICAARARQAHRRPRSECGSFRRRSHADKRTTPRRRHAMGQAGPLSTARRLLTTSAPGEPGRGPVALDRGDTAPQNELALLQRRRRREGVGSLAAPTPRRYI